LLIPQFLKPIYLFRLRVIGIGLRSLYGMSALGFFFVIISALCAQIPGLLPGFFGHPLVWEIIASVLFSVAYGVLGWVYMFPPRAGMRSIDKYVRPGANFLAGPSMVMCGRGTNSRISGRLPISSGRAVTGWPWKTSVERGRGWKTPTACAVPSLPALRMISARR
jgi:hypothetical protein